MKRFICLLAKSKSLAAMYLFMSALKTALCRSRVATFMAAIALVCTIGGCASAPISRQVSYDPLLGRQGGVLLLVDSSVQIDVLAGEDYFVTNEAKAGGQAALASLHKYIADSGIPICGEVISVCGARLNSDNSPIIVADSVGETTHPAQQPLWTSVSITNDPRYISALGVVTTYAFERAAVSSAKTKTGDNASSSDNPPPTTSINDFFNAAKVIKAKTQASSVLFMGLLGKSRSSGKAVAQFIGSFTVGMAVAVATAGLGTGYYLIYSPGHGSDGMVMEGALIDLDTGQLTWSNAVKASGDPIKPENMANKDNFYLLFHNLLFNNNFVQATHSLN